MRNILIIHDIHVGSGEEAIGWAYWRRSQALKKYAPADFNVDTCQTSEIPWEEVSEYDLIFNLEYAAPQVDKFRKKGFEGVWVLSYNSDANRRHKYWQPAVHHSDFLIVNNMHAWEFRNRQGRTCCISNGVDTDVFVDAIPIRERPDKCIFAGSSGVTKGKGWEEVFWPLEQVLPDLGFETDFREVNDINFNEVMPTSKTVEWYNDASYCLIASASEGTPNLLTEAVACGCIAISVPVGNILEWGAHKVNCMITERNPESFIDALAFARNNKKRLSEQGKRDIRNGWSYGEPGNRAAYFFQLFRRLIDDGPSSVDPFSYAEIDWRDI